MGKLTAQGEGPAESPALAALAGLAADAVKRPTDEQLDRGLKALRHRLGDLRRSRRRWRPLALVAAALVLAAGIGSAPILRKRWSSPPPVAVDRIEGGALLDGGYLSESGHGGIRLLFNEGSSFVLAPGTRGRLREVLKDGARFSLEEGGASFQITPHAGRRWSVEAGPFLVTVKGTAFKVDWDPASERFELLLQRGRVVVDGPVAGGGIPLRAGQHLVIALPKGQIVITEGAREETGPRRTSPPEPAVVATPIPAHAAPRAKVAVASPPRRAAEDRGWAGLLAEGRWDRILADVDREGVDAALKSASSEELLAIADAARYRRRVDLARAALLAQRRRFPGSARALDALFLLGRVEELSPGGAARAVATYDDYLARAPRGGYAAEALGRKMILMNDLGGPSKARPVAEEYLLRFPGGSYQAAARALAHAR